MTNKIEKIILIISLLGEITLSCVFCIVSFLPIPPVSLLKIHSQMDYTCLNPYLETYFSAGDL